MANTQASARNAKRTARLELSTQSPDMLRQIADQLPGKGQRAGMLAAGFLSKLRERPADELERLTSQMALPATIRERNPSDESDALLAVAGAAMLQASRSGRATAAERIDQALKLLDDELGAGF